MWWCFWKKTLEAGTSRLFSGKPQNYGAANALPKLWGSLSSSRPPLTYCGPSTLYMLILLSPPPPKKPYQVGTVFTYFEVKKHTEQLSDLVEVTQLRKRQKQNLVPGLSPKKAWPLRHDGDNLSLDASFITSEDQSLERVAREGESDTHGLTFQEMTVMSFTYPFSRDHLLYQA